MANFTEIDEEFICEHCGKKVEKLNYSCRDHCSHCLYAKHVDINPGDRSEDCKGLLEPVGMMPDSKKGYVIIFKCKKCGNKIKSSEKVPVKIERSLKNSKFYETPVSARRHLSKPICRMNLD